MEWISVKDRLPEVNKLVQVWNNGWKLAKRRIVGDTTLWHYNNETLYSYDAPSHWQPLPLAPSQKE